jgi:subtilisin family serine protease
MEEMGKRGVDVLNISFGGEEEDDGNFPLTKEAEYLVSKGMNVVCAIGNKRTGIISYPASGGNVISVGSIDGKGKPSYFSNYGRTFDGRKKPEVVSYGEDIVVKKSRKGRLGFSLDEDYTLVSGTSFACPMVAGIVALLRGCMNNEKKVRSSIFETAEKPESLILNGLAFVEDMFVGIMRMLGINVGLFAGEVVSGADAYGRYGIVRAAKAMSFLSGREINKFIKGYGKLLRRHTGVGG